ncbi:MAG: bifunctional transcriptional activator/DNA repair enzyme AdaA [Gemmatimonadales bacterium]
MLTSNLPPAREMYKALSERDSGYDGVFFTAVRTTGVFCRPTCPAKKPRFENVEFFGSVADALSAGYRPCKRCRPLEFNGSTPEWLRPLLDDLEQDPNRRRTDADLRSMSLDPSRVRRWFRANHGMTFHAYQRARRLAAALGQIRHGGRVPRTAYDHGYESLSGFHEAFRQYFGVTPGQSRTTQPAFMTRLLTPLGPMVACTTDDGVCLLEFADRPMLRTQIERIQQRLHLLIAPGSNHHTEQLGEELRRYFAGDSRRFEVPLSVPGSPFQLAVWRAVQQIPYGATTTYEQLARDIGSPQAQRAVGRANGDNRLAIVIPCHRVIRADGELSGYGGGRWRKRALLEHERSHR